MERSKFKVVNEGRVCGTCRHFSRDPSASPTVTAGGTCRRNPPQLVGAAVAGPDGVPRGFVQDGFFPTIGDPGSTWCGEYGEQRNS